MAMFDRLNAQQQPFIQSGYGAMGRLNTLLGLGSGGRPRGMPLQGGGELMPRGGQMPPVVNAGPNGAGVRLPPRLSMGPSTQGMQGGSSRLRQLLALRAANGDTEAARIMESV
jgi:hypothetical protein